jgi:signal transduction histidine kinase
MVAAQSDPSLSARARLNRLRSLATAVSGRGQTAPAVWLPVVALCALAAVDLRGLAPVLAAAALAWGLLVAGAMLAAGPREKRSADDRARRAVDRAMAAENAQRARADELADVLRASQGLVLLGEGKLDFMGILAPITPAGATSFLAKVEGSESVVVAAHGPLAPWCIGQRRPCDAGRAESGPALASLSASGRIVGEAMPTRHLTEVAPDIQAALGVRFCDHDGRALGWLHLIDPEAERVLEPTFVSVAQLVANQIGVAMENRALMSRAQDQLHEMQRVQQQLVQVAKLGAVGELAAAVAHEVNNPLTGILGFAELLLADLPADDPRHQEVAIIQAEAVRARTIVRSLLEFARPRPPRRVPTDLDDLVRSTVDLIRFRADEASVWIAEEYGRLPAVPVDPDAFKQVVLNLLNNAIEAMPHGGKIRVATAAEGERVCVTIGDSGIGMDDRTRDRIFTPFFTTRAGKAGGTGLGLSMSLQIVESHGGAIEVDSEPGRGTVFTIRLPLLGQDGGVATAPDSDAALIAAASRSDATGEPQGTGAAA